MTVREYIESGALELYVLGSASEAETEELLRLKKEYPEIQDALFELETDLERMARHMAIAPPPGMLTKIEENINALVEIPEYRPLVREEKANKQEGNKDAGNQFIEIEAESNRIRVHKNWKPLFIAVFILSKIFLISAIYFYLENRQAQQQIQELKTELRQHHLR